MVAQQAALARFARHGLCLQPCLPARARAKQDGNTWNWCPVVRYIDVLPGSKVLTESLEATTTLTPQGLEPQLGEVVKSLKQAWGVEYIYAWHGLPAYWAGVAVGESYHCYL